MASCPFALEMFSFTDLALMPLPPLCNERVGRDNKPTWLCKMGLRKERCSLCFPGRRALAHCLPPLLEEMP